MGILFEMVADDVLHNHLALIEFGEPYRMRQGFIRIGGEICRKENFLEAVHWSPPEFRSHRTRSRQLHVLFRPMTIGGNPLLALLSRECAFARIHPLFAQLSKSREYGLGPMP